jgi:hypothetical protein
MIIRIRRKHSAILANRKAKRGLDLEGALNPPTAAAVYCCYFERQPGALGLGLSETSEYLAHDCLAALV